MSDRHPVPFEHAGLVPIVGLLLLGSSTTFGAVSTYTMSSEPAPKVEKAEPQTPAPPPAPTPMPTPSVTAAPSPSAAPVASSAEPKPQGPCAPKVTVQFGYAEVAPSPNAPAKLATFAKFLIDHPDVTLAVNGHADSTGSDDGNIALSHKRARAVAKILEDAGVAKSRMTVRGYGAFQPLEGSDEAAPDNRRVLLRVRGMPSCDQTPEEVIAP